MPKEKTEKEQRDQVREDHERFRKNLTVARENRDFVRRTVADSRMVTILSRYEKDIDDQKESLITADKKNVDSLQASILARRQLLATFKGAYEHDVEEAQRQLTEFERNNALFLTEKVDASTGEIVKTA